MQPHDEPPGGGLRVLLVSGSTRDRSTNTAAVRTVAALAPALVTPVVYGGLAELPAFNPDHDGDRLPAAVASLRQEIAAAAAVLFCTPEYAGTLPGSLKNLLDWTVGGGEMDGKPAAWVNVAAPGRGAGAAATLGRPCSPGGGPGGQRGRDGEGIGTFPAGADERALPAVLLERPCLGSERAEAVVAGGGGLAAVAGRRLVGDVPEKLEAHGLPADGAGRSRCSRRVAPSYSVR